VRQDTFDASYAQHPERYVNCPPRAKRPPKQVAINPSDGIMTDTAATLLQQPGGFTPAPHVEQLQPPEVVT
jgi:hypothetical protein